MDPWQLPGFRRICFWAITTYIALGSLGVTWLSDDFDTARFAFYQWVAFPLALCFYALWLLSPQFILSRKEVVWTLMALLITTFAWGNGLLVDYIAGEPKTSHQIGEGTMAFKRGLSGQFYETRF